MARLEEPGENGGAWRERFCWVARAVFRFSGSGKITFSCDSPVFPTGPKTLRCHHVPERPNPAKWVYGRRDQRGRGKESTDDELARVRCDEAISGTGR